MNSGEAKEFPPHVLIFPLPVMGHVNPMLNLAHLLCLSQIQVTFVVSDFTHLRLLKNTAVHSIFAQYSDQFQFRAISDGLPDDHPRSGDKAFDLFPALARVMLPLFKKTMREEDFFAFPGCRRPITCMIVDGSLGLDPDFAQENGIPIVNIRTPSAASFWSFFRLPELIESHEIPLDANSMDELVKSVPGMEGFLRRRDLPIFRVDDANDPIIQVFNRTTQYTLRAQAFILNTFEDLEGPVISQIQNHMPIRVYTLGPLHYHLKSRLTDNTAILSSSFWAEDLSCIDWLNKQPPKSVIYVSFGSIAVVTREQLLEFWHGLVNSSQRFLWVLRPDSITGKDGENEIPAELKDGTEERGYLVEWAPQETVLNHPAVGGFLTHSGWNSTLESIAAGVPMICWPYFGDQMINSRFVSEIWKIGLDIKDSCDRLVIENAIRELMQVRKDEFLESADNMARLMKKAVSKGGSSYGNLDDLIEYIRSFVI